MIFSLMQEHATAKRGGAGDSGRAGDAGGAGAGGVMTMSGNLPVRRLPIRLMGDDRRVILRPFVMSNGRVRTLFERLDAMSDEAVATLLAEVTASFADR